MPDSRGTASPGDSVDVSISSSPFALPRDAERIFDAGAWQAWRTADGEPWFTIGPQGRSSWFAGMSTDGVGAKLSIFWCGGRSGGKGRPDAIPNPFSYPVDQILLMHLLPLFGAVVVHAAGFVTERGEGLVCAGRSGAGKTTISLAADRAGRRVLSDDRVIVRDCGGEFRIYGTPWPGDGGFARNESAPLAGVRFIEKSGRNATVPLTAAAAAARLFPVCSIPWYDRECADRCVELLDRLVSTVPCAVLECTPDERAVQALESGVPVVPFVRTLS